MEHLVLVTGASTGFGEATVRRFLAHGHKVIALSGEEKCLEALKASLPADQQKKLLSLVVDLCDRAQVDGLAAALPAAFADVTLLVNIPGLAGLESAQNVLPADWGRVIDINVKGLVHVTRAFLPGMVERQCGHVINIGALTSNHPRLGGHFDGGTKAFVHQFSLNLRADLIGTPIRVTCIEPDVRFAGDDKANEVDSSIKALGADDVAEAIYWSANLPSHMNINIVELMPVR